MEEERYHVIKKLGEGATAQVFLVSDRLLGRNMAVKQGADKALLLAEAKVLASVSHAAFPVLYDYREDEKGNHALCYRTVFIHAPRHNIRFCRYGARAVQGRL